MESLIGRLGNEVRETIHHVMGLLELVAEERLSESQSQYLWRCGESTDKLLRTTRDLAELGRAEGVAIRPNPFSPADAVAEIADLMGILAIRKGLEFRLCARIRRSG